MTTVKYEKKVADTCKFDGVVNIGALASLGREDLWRPISETIMRTASMAADVINDRGGLVVSGQKFAVQLKWVGDGSELTQVTNATAHLSRADGGTRFLIGPYGSSLTKYATMQSDAERKIMIAPAAATSQVIAGSELTFGILPPPSKFVDAFAELVREAAQQCDDSVEGKVTTGADNKRSKCNDEPWLREYCLAGGTHKSCVSALRVGFLHEATAFPTATCKEGPGRFENAGISVATDSNGAPLVVSVDPWAGPSNGVTNGSTGSGPPMAEDAAYVNQLADALKVLQDGGVTVIMGCTYFDSAVGMVAALQQLDYNPLAVGFT